MRRELLTYAEVDRRIEGLPEGPMGAMRRPPGMLWLERLGYVGVILGLAPALIVQFLKPAGWMLSVAVVGLALTAVGFLPVIVRDLLVLFRSMGRAREEFIRQWDHDFIAFEGLLAWLTAFPRDALEQRLRFAQAAQTRIASKMGLIYGGADRLGMVPLIAAMYVQFDALSTTDFDIPLWKIIVGFFALIVSAAAFQVSHVRLRLELHAALLAEALERKST